MNAPGCGRNRLGPGQMIEEALPGLVRWYHEHRAWTEAIRSGAYLEDYERQYGNRL